MKKILLISIALFLSLLVLPIVYAQTSYTSFSISSYTIPSTLEPGEQGNLVITINNVGTLHASNVKLRLLSNPYVELENYAFDLQTIGEGKSFQVVVPIKILSSVKTRTLVISYELEYSEGGSTASKTIYGTIGLTIERRPSLEILNISYDREIIPGSETKLSFIVKNVGKGEARDVTLNLTFTNLPFVPLGGTRIFLGDIEPMDSKKVEIGLIVNDNAEIKAYSLPLQFSYYTESGEEKTEKETIGIKVSGEPEFVVSIDKADLYSDSIGKLAISIANRGVGTAKYLTVKLESDLKITPAEYYIGNLESDDYETADFDVNLFGVKPGTYQIKIKLFYNNPYNEEMNTTKTLSVAVKEKINISTIYLLAIVIALLFFVLIWKRRILRKYFRK
jgi:hypothetical protein